MQIKFKMVAYYYSCELTDKILTSEYKLWLNVLTLRCWNVCWMNVWFYMKHSGLTAILHFNNQLYLSTKAPIFSHLSVKLLKKNK